MEDKGVGCTTDGRRLLEVYLDSQIRGSLCLQDEEGRLVPSLTEKAAPPLSRWPEGVIREGETKNEPTLTGLLWGPEPEFVKHLVFLAECVL